MSAKNLRLLFLILAVSATLAPRTALAENGRKETLHRALADIYVKLGNSAGALQEYQALEKIAPNDDKIEFNYGILLARQKEFALAVLHYRKAVQLAPTAENYKGLGDALYWNKDIRGADDAYNKARQLPSGKLKSDNPI